MKKQLLIAGVALFVIIAIFSGRGGLLAPVPTLAQVGGGLTTSPTEPLEIFNQTPTLFLGGPVARATCYRYRVSDAPFLSPEVGWSEVYLSDCVPGLSHQVPPDYLVFDQVYRFDAQSCRLAPVTATERAPLDCSGFSTQKFYFIIKTSGGDPGEICYQEFLLCMASLTGQIEPLQCIRQYEVCLEQANRTIAPSAARPYTDCLVRCQGVPAQEQQACYWDCVITHLRSSGAIVSADDVSERPKFVQQVGKFFSNIGRAIAGFADRVFTLLGLKKAAVIGPILPGLTTVDLKVNGQDTTPAAPLTVPQNQSVTLTWVSQNATTCATTSVSPFNVAVGTWNTPNKTPVTNGSQIYGYTSDLGLYTFTITCGVATDSVHIKVDPLYPTGPNLEVVRRGPGAGQIGIAVTPSNVVMTSTASCSPSCSFQTATAKVSGGTQVTLNVSNIPPAFGNYTIRAYPSDGFGNGTRLGSQFSSYSSFFPNPPACFLQFSISGNSSCTFSIPPSEVPFEVWIEPTTCAEDVNTIFNLPPTTATVQSATSALLTTTISASAPIPSGTSYAAQLAFGPTLQNFTQNTVTTGPNPTGTFTGAPLTLSGIVSPLFPPSSFYGGVKLTKTQLLPNASSIVTQCNLRLPGTDQSGNPNPDIPITPVGEVIEPTDCKQDLAANYFSFTNFTPTQVPPPVSVNFPATVIYTGPTISGTSYSVRLKYDTNPVTLPTSTSYVGPAQTLPATFNASVTIGGTVGNLLPNTTYYVAVEIVKILAGVPSPACVHLLDVSFETAEEPPLQTTVGISARKFTLNQSNVSFNSATPFLFDLSGPNNYFSQKTLDTDPNTAPPSNDTFLSVPVGASSIYVLKEFVPSGWVTTNIVCSAVGGSATFAYSATPTTTPYATITYPANSANAAASVACNFTNKLIDT